MIFENCSLNEFKRIITKKRLICFGVGKYFDELCMDEPTIIDSIDFAIDNNSLLWGKYRSIQGHDIRILSLNEAILHIDNSCVLVITTGFEYFPIIKEQLDNVQALNSVSLYWCWLILDSPVTKAELGLTAIGNNRLSDKPLIPKIIHYAWFGNNPIPQRFQEFIDGWKKLCPDYQIKEWNEHNYDITKNTYMKQAYEAKFYGFVPDYLRKDVIYEYGGIYLDTDVEMIKNIDDLLYQDGFCAFERMHVAFGLGFGARKHLPIIKALRDQYDDLEFSFSGTANVFTGPYYETKKLCEYGLKRNGKYQQIAGITVYPSVYAVSTSLFEDINYVTDKTYLVHHCAASWHDANARNLCIFIKNMIGSDYLLK